jgi:hypothetical protein
MQALGGNLALLFRLHPELQITMAKMKASVLRWALLERQEEEEEKVNVEQIKLAFP